MEKLRRWLARGTHELVAVVEEALKALHSITRGLGESFRDDAWLLELNA